MKKLVVISLLLIFQISFLYAEDGYRLWLRYDLIKNSSFLTQYRSKISGIQLTGNSPTLLAAKEELTIGLEGLLGKKVSTQTAAINNCLIAGTPKSSSFIASLSIKEHLEKGGEEGYVILTTKNEG
ncbi:MAG TPA: alpha-glucuronidase family glycosyl hydrolase, partial [Flavisolibacter sp.]|nr:alpha-glucuronidase family glycosyl hydrolase [Flavisolibacter sp.]